MSRIAVNSPPGWAHASLEDFCEIVQGQSPPGETYNTNGNGLPFFQGKAEFGDLYPTPVKWCSSPSKIAEKEDVLISVRAPVGPTNLCPMQACIGRGLAAIRPLGGIGPRYVLYGLRYTQDKLVALSTGSTFGAISGDTLRSHQLPVAPLLEQGRIVAEIEKQFTRLEAGVAALKRVQANLKRYRAAVLKAAVEGRMVPTEAELARREGRSYEPASELLKRILAERRARWETAQLAKTQGTGRPPRDERWNTKYSEPAAPDHANLPPISEGWVWAKLDQLLVYLRNGISRKPDLEVGVPILRISAVRPRHVDMGDVRYLGGDLKDYADYVLQVGDLLFTRYNGNPALTGVCAVVRTVERSTVHPDKLIRAKVLGELCLPTFLEAVLNAGAAHEFIASRVRTTAGQAGISGGDIRSTPVPLAPITEQRRIVAEVERRLSVIDELEMQVEANLRRAERLRQAILKRAFEGKLVPQDPSDEPASMLLERIRAARSTGNTATLGCAGATATPGSASKSTGKSAGATATLGCAGKSGESKGTGKSAGATKSHP
jgi:type I restriction enzyme, S subunit